MLLSMDSRRDFRPWFQWQEEDLAPIILSGAIPWKHVKQEKECWMPFPIYPYNPEIKGAVKLFILEFQGKDILG